MYNLTYYWDDIEPGKADYWAKYDATPAGLFRKKYAMELINYIDFPYRQRTRVFQRNFDVEYKDVLLAFGLM